MLVQRRIRWAVVVQVLYKCFVFAGYAFTSLGKRDSGDKKKQLTPSLPGQSAYQDPSWYNYSKSDWNFRHVWLRNMTNDDGNFLHVW